jgi:hypothetical protein
MLDDYSEVELASAEATSADARSSTGGSASDEAGGADQRRMACDRTRKPFGFDHPVWIDDPDRLRIT